MSDLKQHLLEHPRNDFIRFFEKDHEYYYYPSGDFRKTKERVQFSGVTGWISSYSKHPFKPKKVAKSCNANPNSKYYDWGEDAILEHWNDKMINGSNIHKAVENVVNEAIYDEEFGFYIDEFWKVMDAEGIEPFVAEFVVYDEDIERATPIDTLGIRKETGKLVILDEKTYEDGMEFLPYKGRTFKHPLGDLYDSKFEKVSLQISIARKWLIDKYDVPAEDIEDGLVLVLNDQGCEAIPTLNYYDYVTKMYDFEN